MGQGPGPFLTLNSQPLTLNPLHARPTIPAEAATTVTGER